MTFKEIINETVQRMNDNEYCTEIIYPNGKAGMIPKAIEIELKKTFSKYYPHADIIHPEDNSGLPDIYSLFYNKGIEIKVTQGWSSRYQRKDGTFKYGKPQATWSNGSVRHDTEYFLFIRYTIENNQMSIVSAYFGKLSYDDRRGWRYHYAKKDEEKIAGMRITEGRVRNICKQII